MSINSLMEILSEQIAKCENESRIYEDLVKRGSEVFESARASSFYDGKVEALSEVLVQLEDQLRESTDTRALHAV